MPGPPPAASRWVVRRPAGPSPAMRLFCLPFAGGGASSYRDWGDDLPAGIEVVAAQLPGHESRLAEEPLSDLGQLLDGLDEGLGPLREELPFALFGHSFGAVLAFELASRWSRGAGRAPSHLVLSARCAPQLERRGEPTHDLPREEMEDWLREMKATPEAVLRDRELVDLMLPALRADLLMDGLYSASPEPRLSCPLTVMGGLSDPQAWRQELAPWSAFTSGVFELRMFPGGHFFPFEESRRAALATIREVLMARGARTA